MRTSIGLGQGSLFPKRISRSSSQSCRMNKMQIRALLQWVSPEVSGRRSPPGVGLRPQIRWQGQIREWLAGCYSAQIVEVDFPGFGVPGECLLRLPFELPECKSWSREIELLDGYRVIAVGVILDFP